MRLTILKGKVHRATVTEADKDYDGSLTIDAVLMEAAGILPNELIHVWDVTRGTRLITYAMRGEPNSGVICVNGAGAHLVHVGDLVIVAAFAEMEEAEARRHQPTIVRVDERNRIRH
ncbi:MAG: aspartate 1-decarboxylase [Gemmataceae bacterium]